MNKKSKDVRLILQKTVEQAQKKSADLKRDIEEILHTAELKVAADSKKKDGEKIAALKKKIDQLPE